MHSLYQEMQSLAQQAKGDFASANHTQELAKSDGQGFANALQEAVGDVNKMQKEAGALSAAFDRGDPNVSLPDVMIAMQKSSIGFNSVLQVRNRLITAYQDIMNMPL